MFWNFSCIFLINHFLVNTIKKWITKLAKRYDKLISRNKLHLCLYWITVVLVSVYDTPCGCWRQGFKKKSWKKRHSSFQRLEGCNILWVTPLSAFVHASSYDLSFLPINLLLIYFFKGDNWCIKSMKWNETCCSLKNKSPSIDCDI